MSMLQYIACLCMVGLKEVQTKTPSKMHHHPDAQEMQQERQVQETSQSGEVGILGWTSSCKFRGHTLKPPTCE